MRSDGWIPHSLHRLALLLLSVLLTAALLFARSPGAQEPEAEMDPGKEHFKKGVAFFNEGNHEAALAEFLESYKLKPNWAVKYNIAVCYKMTNRYRKSLRNFLEYLDEGKEVIPDERKEEVEGYIRELEEKIGAVKFCCNLGTVKVVVDKIETLEVEQGQKVKLDPGLHEVNVLKDGYEKYIDEIIVVAGETKSVLVKLVPLGGKKPKHVETEGVKDTETEKTAPEKKKKKIGEIKWLIVGLVVGGGIGAASAASGAVVLKKKDLMESEVAKCPVIHDRSDCRKAFEIQDEAEKWKLATNILIAGAAASASAGLIAYLVLKSKHKRESKERKVSWAASLYPEAGLSLRVDF